MKRSITSKIFHFRKRLEIAGYILIGIFILNIAGFYNKIFGFQMNINFSAFMIGTGLLLTVPNAYFSTKDDEGNDTGYNAYIQRFWILPLIFGILFITFSLTLK
jgi:hypothetical protein